MIASPFDLRTIAEKMVALAFILLAIMVFAAIVKRDRKKLKYFIATAIFLQMVYLTWRALFTIPQQNSIGFFFGILLFLAELFALVQSTTHRLMFMRDFKVDEKTLANLDSLPHVDILIATYNEPVSILKNTVAAAVNQSYPKDKFTVYICDDAHREEVRELAELYGAVWAVRDDHTHAKAGNLNNCLKHYAKGELFAVLDADMIPKSTFLERTVGYFSDPEMALVQAPQVFYNPDPFQSNLQLFSSIPNEQDFFMREVLTRRAMYNAVLNVGSNAVFRRSAIEEIGYIPVGTITEDMATSMLLQAKKFKTIFINENLAMGLSPETFSDYVIQRDRWCRGNIQVLKKWNPLTLPGLTFMQRLIYFDGVLYWFFGLQKIIYNIGPILLLITGIPIYYSDVFTMLVFFVPTYYSATLIFKLFNHKTRNYTWAHIYETALAPYLLVSALSELFFSKKVKFSVTPKGKTASAFSFAYKAALPHLILAGFSFTALGIGIWKMLTDVNYMVPVYLVNIFWLFYNLLGVLTAIFVCFEKPRYRSAERFPIDCDMTITLDDGSSIPSRLLDISTLAIAVEPDKEIESADSLVGRPVSIHIPPLENLPGTIFRSRSWGKKLIIQFGTLTKDEHTRLLSFIFDNQLDGYGILKESSILSTLAEITKKWWKALVKRK